MLKSPTFDDRSKVTQLLRSRVSACKSRVLKDISRPPSFRFCRIVLRDIPPNSSAPSSDFMQAASFDCGPVLLRLCTSLGYCEALAVFKALPELSQAQSFARSYAIAELTAKCLATILSEALFGRFFFICCYYT